MNSEQELPDLCDACWMGYGKDCPDTCKHKDCPCVKKGYSKKVQRALLI